MMGEFPPELSRPHSLDRSRHLSQTLEEQKHEEEEDEEEEAPRTIRGEEGSLSEGEPVCQRQGSVTECQQYDGSSSSASKPIMCVRITWSSYVVDAPMSSSHGQES